MRRTIYPRFHPALAMASLLLVVVWLYAPTLGFGFFWDDPLWFSRIVGKSLGELIQPTPDYQFYRSGLRRTNGAVPFPGFCFSCAGLAVWL